MLDHFLGDYDYNRLRQSGPKLSTKKKHEYIQTKLDSTIYLFTGIECSLQYVLDCHLQAKRNIRTHMGFTASNNCSNFQVKFPGQIFQQNLPANFSRPTSSETYF